MPPPGVCMNIMQERYKKDGVGTIAKPQNLFDQDFQLLKEYCVVRRVRYIDEMFPPDNNSIGEGLLSPSDLAKVVWKRPYEIAQNPSFIVDGVTRFDFGQGEDGDCWFIASIGALTFQKHIFEQVVPVNQSFDGDYCGIFHFRFWRFGKWVDVTIDDKLPTINGRLIFLHSTTPNEFWPPLLEKAYAKVCGSYADLNAGSPSEALEDFTGEVHIGFQLADAPPNLWDMMSRAALSKSLMGCGTPPGKTAGNPVAPNGLVRGHAYTVTGVMKLMSQGILVHLVRLWNPWCHGEWNGDWSDNSPLWQTVSSDDRRTCLRVDDNGEFWMKMEDFCSNFSDVDICCLSPDFLDGSSCNWKSSINDGRWVAGVTAGGCKNFPDSFWTNPQYRVKIEGLDQDCDKEKGDNMLVSLMQKPDKRYRHLAKRVHIGFTIFKVPEEYKGQRGKFPATFFTTNAPVAQTKSFLNARDVMGLFHLKPGEYLIVPSTYNPNETASFILSIFSKAETDIRENSGDLDEAEVIKPKPTESGDNVDNKKKLFRQYSDQYEEVDAERLQKILNDHILKGDTNNGGFSLDSCRSMVALMDTSITGKLNGAEFLRLMRKVTMLKEIFFTKDVSRTGTLSLSELRNAVMASGLKVSDEMLNLMAVRYGASSGNMTLESFISLILRMQCMEKIFKQLSDGKMMSLRESEWMYISMYT